MVYWFGLAGGAAGCRIHLAIIAKSVEIGGIVHNGGGLGRILRYVALQSFLANELAAAPDLADSGGEGELGRGSGGRVGQAPRIARAIAGLARGTPGPGCDCRGQGPQVVGKSGYVRSERRFIEV